MAADWSAPTLALPVRWTVSPSGASGMTRRRIASTASFVMGVKGGRENPITTIDVVPSSDDRESRSSGRLKADWVRNTLSGASGDRSHSSTSWIHARSPSVRPPDGGRRGRRCC
jgi:hypothetical protein